ncbi:hypothetical protein ABPG72_003285 [Tetrahymena utriculariae]
MTFQHFYEDPAPTADPSGDQQSVISVDKMYGLVVISALTLCFQCAVYGYFLVGRYRSKIFNKSFLEAEFGQLHRDVTQRSIEAGGYPDMGSGVYAQRLDYYSWLLFNKAQRIHSNFQETLPISVFFLLVAGLQFPITASVFGFIQVFARLLSLAYISNQGATHPLRRISSLLISVSIFTTFVLAFIKGVYVIKNHGK